MKSTSRMFKAFLLGEVILLLGFALVGQAAAQTWIQLAPIGGPPEASGGTAVYDPNSNRAIGPWGNHTTEVWALAHADGLGGTPEWVNIVPAGAFGPPGRHANAAAYDSINNRMIIFSGCGGGCFPVLTDVWVLANADGFDPSGNPAAASWSQLFPTPDPGFGAPAGRAGAVAVYDPSSNQMILFGGQNGGGFGGATFPEVWRLTHANGLGGTSAWSRVATAGTFAPGQCFPAGAYDAANNRMIVFSGTAQATGVNTNAVWALSNANGTEAGTPTWTNVVAEGAAGSPPAGGWRHFTTYDPVNSRLIFLDFVSGANVATWVLHHANGLGGPAAWQQLVTSGQPTSDRALANPVCNATSNRLTAFRSTPSGVGFEAWVLTDANGIVAPTNNCQADLAAAQQEIQNLQDQLTAANATIQSLQTQLANANSSIQNLQAQVSALQSQLTAANATIQSQQSQIAALQAQVASLQNDLAQLNGALSAAVGALQADLRQVFGAPSFVVPGATPRAQVEAIVQAILNLNTGRKQGVFMNLGGAP